ncbi:hypothetical protein UFOVP117_185 [uncultured Caudovirales phage]|jgi:hypothetical protein|uniref:Uncharacterized protein n=1 Tax=uncultured Caudovirales phage TaxID=2100421 RepID=A0A6J5LAJ7_9CAUD|nr:hypothetical protein UFOVP117_185 [uncultured Caudovirales phage]
MKTFRKIMGMLPMLIALYLFVVLAFSAFTGTKIDEYVDVKWWGLFLLVELWSELKYQKLREIE